MRKVASPSGGTLSLSRKGPCLLWNDPKQRLLASHANREILAHSEEASLRFGEGGEWVQAFILRTSPGPKYAEALVIFSFVLFLPRNNELR
jgi:hypothetical protein